MKKIVVVGGGISGLSAGIFGQQNGYETIILERHNKVGGLCTFWERNGFHVDGSVHWLTGTQEGTDLYNIWSRVGVIKENNFFIQDTIGIMDYKGEKLTLYRNPKKLKEEFYRVGPNDKKAIDRFFKDLKAIVNVPLPLCEPINTMSLPMFLKTGVKIAPYLFSMIKAATNTCENYGSKFKSPILRFFFENFQPGPGNVYSFMYSFGNIFYGNGGIPNKASNGVVSGMEEKYLSLGGKIRTNSPVKKINIDGKTVKSVTLESGEIIECDYVVSAIDAYALLNKLLAGKYKDKTFDKRLNNIEKNPCPSAFLAYFAIDKEKFNSTFHTYNQYFPTDGIVVGKEHISSIVLRSFGYDNYFDNNGKTIMEIYVEQYPDSFDYWKMLYDTNRSSYYAKKQEICNKFISKIIEQYPQYSVDDFKYLDSFTPVTLARYTDNYKGSFMSFMMTSKIGPLLHKGKIKGINNLYVASQWSLSPGGLPLAVSSGMFSIQRILKHEKKNHLFFKTSKYKFD